MGKARGRQHSEKSGPNWRGLSVAQEVLWLCARCRMEPKLMNRCKPEKMRDERVWESVEDDSQTPRVEGARQKGERGKLKEKRRVTRKVRKEEWRKSVVEHCQKETCWKAEERCPQRNEM